MTSAGGDSGVADLTLHLVQDSSGAILSGSADFYLAYQFPNDTSVTGLGITSAGGGASFLIPTDISGSSPVQARAGNGRISSQAQVAPGNAAGLAVLKGLLANPGQYSVSVVTADHPAGDMSGLLQSASTATLMAVLSSGTATGAATVTVLYTGPAYQITSGEVAMQASYQFPAQVTFSSLRVYEQSGQIAMAAALIPGTLSSAGGAGVLTAPASQIDMSDSQMVHAVQNMLLGPGNFSVQVGTVESPAAPLSGQLRSTDFMTFQIPGFANSGGASLVGLHTLREASGNVLAGTVVFDVNYRLAPGSEISQVDIDGQVIAPAVATDPSGSGNIYAAAGVYNGAGLTSLNGIVSDPEAHQINLRTSGSGTVLSMALAEANAESPVVAAVIPVWTAGDLTTLAPGEIVEIYGTNLAKVTTDLSGWPGGSLPSALNGVSVTMGGQTARLLYVSPIQVDAALAFETPTGSQLISLNNGNADSAPVSLEVAGIAPAVFTLAYKNADLSMVSSSNPAHAGDVLVFYTTGMGQTTPVLLTGGTVPLGPPYFNTAPVTVTIGGVDAGVIYSIGAPPYVAGLYQMAVTVPAGLGPGSQPVVATSGGLRSNTVNIAIQ